MNIMSFCTPPPQVVWHVKIVKKKEKKRRKEQNNTNKQTNSGIRGTPGNTRLLLVILLGKLKRLWTLWDKRKTRGHYGCFNWDYISFWSASQVCMFQREQSPHQCQICSCWTRPGKTCENVRTSRLEGPSSSPNQWPNRKPRSFIQ